MTEMGLGTSDNGLCSCVVFTFDETSKLLIKYHEREVSRFQLLRRALSAIANGDECNCLAYGLLMDTNPEIATVSFSDHEDDSE